MEIATPLPGILCPGLKLIKPFGFTVKVDDGGGRLFCGQSRENQKR